MLWRHLSAYSTLGCADAHQTQTWISESPAYLSFCLPEEQGAAAHTNLGIPGRFKQAYAALALQNCREYVLDTSLRHAEYMADAVSRCCK